MAIKVDKANVKRVKKSNTAGTGKKIVTQIKPRFNTSATPKKKKTSVGSLAKNLANKLKTDRATSVQKSSKKRSTIRKKK